MWLTLVINRFIIVIAVLLFFSSGTAYSDEEKGESKEKSHISKKASRSASSEMRKQETAKRKKSSKGRKASKQAAKVVPVAETRPPAVAKELKYWSTQDYSRIAVTLDRESHFEYHRLEQDKGANLPIRLYIDISNCHLSSDVKDVSIADGLLKTARVSQFRPDTVRVVIDMESIKDYKVFTFSDPYRILIDVHGDRKTEISALKPKLESSPSLIVLTDQKEIMPEKQFPKLSHPAISKIRRIVVDAGHGGHDPGAIGISGTKEKDIVLSIAQKVARRIKDDLGLDVVMTRSTDIFLELQERTAIANQVGADLFISIHANAAQNRAVSGIETYYLSLAKTEKAAQLAAKENGTSLEKVSMLQAVLFDLMANYKINDSAHLAEVIQKELYKKIDGRWPVKSLGVKQGPFYVLVGATMPSVLVETAFLSNEKEEHRLIDPQYQEMTADGILDGVKAYISGTK